MHNRTVFTVAPRNESWYVTREGSDEVEGRYRFRADAIEQARELAMRQEIGLVRIAQMDGSIQCELTFANDPNLVEG